MAIHNLSNRRVFHYKDGLYAERLPDNSVRIFRALKSVMYYTHDKGFHDPETELAVFDAEGWGSLNDCLDKAP